MIKRSRDGYLEYMIHNFYNDLLILQELEGLTDDELETLYAVGYNYFTYGKYEQAKDVFVELTAYDPFTSHYWRALGAVNQQLGNYKEAIPAYDMAIVNDNGDVVSYVYRGESKILSGIVKEALKDFEKVFEFEEYNEFKPWIERSRLLLDIHGKSE